FFGIVLGDGNLSHFQITITLGTKEISYAEYISGLMGEIFGPTGTVLRYANGYISVYLGSVKATQWLQAEGLVFNKVKSQVAAPPWIFEKAAYMRSFLRGFFDTDGSVYKLRFGIQISLTNFSTPLLISLQRMLTILNYNVSAISRHHLYITKISDIRRFFDEIAPKNQKHNERFKRFIACYKDLHR
ncbi:MAG TPA: LAGLIDADG family homing endonuclease, partial [Candidatus Paceibacterota bacterium]|nr:LAGLIDADG family homing endonuclease [Candidatus Paceibacterota bacterium]